MLKKTADANLAPKGVEVRRLQQQRRGIVRRSPRRKTIALLAGLFHGRIRASLQEGRPPEALRASLSGTSFVRER
jgi:hypothetical protein